MSLFDTNLFGADGGQKTWESLLMREWLNKGNEETKNISNARIQEGLFQDTNEQRAERSRETMSKLSEKEWEQYLGSVKKRNDKGKWQLPAGLGQIQHRISNKDRERQCILLSFFEKLYIRSGFLAGWGQAPTITGYPEATREKWRREALKNEPGPGCDVVTIETTPSGSQEGQCLSSEQLTSY